MSDPAAPPCAAPLPHTSRPRLATPALACDTHAHILGPASRYPYASERVYTPPDCLLPDYLAMLDALGVQRCVLVQPSVYGSDNRVLLAALRELGPRARGVAVIDDTTSDDELDAMHAAGVRGLRVNLVDRRDKGGPLPVAQLRALAARIAGLGWHLELLAHVNEYPHLDDVLADFPVPLVFGHLGYAPASLGTDDAGFQALLTMARRGQAFVKLTGPYRLTTAPLPYQPVEGFAHTLVKICPQQLLWGSDWPHVMLKGDMPDDAKLFDLLLDWVGDEKLREQILVHNPARLYGW